MIFPPILHEIIFGIAGICGVMLNLMGVMAVLGRHRNEFKHIGASESLQIVKTTLAVFAIVIFIPLTVQDFGGQGMKTIVLQGVTDVVEILLFHSTPLVFLGIAYVHIKTATSVGGASARCPQKWGFHVLGICMIPAAVLIVIRIVLIVVQARVFSQTKQIKLQVAEDIVSGMPVRKLMTIVLTFVDVSTLTVGTVIYVDIHKLLTKAVRQKLSDSNRSKLAQKSISIQIIIALTTWSFYAIVKMIDLVDEELFPRYISTYSQLVILILSPIGDGLLMQKKWNNITCIKSISFKKAAVQPVNEERSQSGNERRATSKYKDSVLPNSTMGPMDANPQLKDIEPWPANSADNSPKTVFQHPKQNIFVRQRSLSKANSKPVLKKRRSDNGVEMKKTPSTSGLFYHAFCHLDQTVCVDMQDTYATPYRTRSKDSGVETENKYSTQFSQHPISNRSRIASANSEKTMINNDFLYISKRRCFSAKSSDIAITLSDLEDDVYHPM